MCVHRASHKHEQAFTSSRQKAVGLLPYIVLIAGAIISSTTTASVFTLFGPQTFVRETGSTVVEHSSFEAPIDGLACLIKVNNGGLQDETYDKVSSSVISLNGTSVFTPDEFNQNVTYLEKSTVLTLENSLDVELRGKPGGALSIRVDCEGYNAPTADNQTVTTNEDTSIDIILSGADIDGDAISYNIKTGPSHGSLTGIAPNLTYTPSTYFNGADSITFLTNDGLFDSNTATVSIVVTAVNNSPIINSIPNTSAVENIVYSYGLVASDVDLGDSLTFGLDAAPSGMAIDSTAGVISWLPSAGDVGTATVTARVTDSGGLFDLQTYQLTVRADYDGDGIADADDTDVDGDGVENAIDQCPNTPLGATVGADGCVPSPQDTDADGIPDGEDLCPNTPIGEAVDITGCSDTQGGGSLPPDPSTVAPPVDPTVSTTLFASTAFLYTGTNPIQTGVAEGTILPYSAAVVRGKILHRDNTPLSGVNIKVHGHDEYGQTLSRLDGEFDLSVNGGGLLTVSYQKAGYLPVQRQIDVPWQDFSILPDVVMIPVDPQVTTIDLADNSMQVAQGSVMTDADGSRQATILFPAGVQAEMVSSDGSTSHLSSLNVRATEYTVGENGPASMPAALPATSGYTYAVELSVDEAISSGAKSVNFNQPVLVYVDNFLNFSVGTPVPSAAYDREQALWIPSKDGRVIEVLSIDATTGLAEVDVNGNGISADNAALAELGISDIERQQVGAKFNIGDTLWRVPIYNFSPHDFNWPRKPKDLRDIELPFVEGPDETKVDKPDIECGSIIECQNRTLGERAVIVGTPYTINYRSDRVPGRRNDSIDIAISGDTISSSLKRIELDVRIANQQYLKTFQPSTDISHTFEWDGKDYYGRKVLGKHKATIYISYVHPVLYSVSSQAEAAFIEEQRSFGLTGTDEEILEQTAREKAEYFSDRSDFAFLSAGGGWDAKTQGLGGWTLSEHHYYDPTGKELFLGDGTRYKPESSDLNLNRLITHFAGNGLAGFGGDGGAALEARIHEPRGLIVASNGDVVFSDSRNNVIRRINRVGIIETIAGTGGAAGFSGDGGPATTAKLNLPGATTFAPNGDLVFVDTRNYRIRRIDSAGVINTIAGTGKIDDPELGLYANPGCDDGTDQDPGPGPGPGSASTSAPIWQGCLATEFNLNNISNIAAAPDGSIYFASSNYIFRIMPDGLIWIAAGNGTQGFNGDEIASIDASLSAVRNLAVGPDGTLYFADAARVRSITPDGLIHTIAGNGIPDNTGDGGLAKDASIYYPSLMSLSPDNSIYIYTRLNSNGTIRKIGPDGIINTVVGTGEDGDILEGGLPQLSKLPALLSMSTGKNDDLYFNSWGKIYQVKSLFNRFDGEAISIPDQNGKQIYQFDEFGKHLRTVHAYTGALINEFSYNSEGYLINITDGDGNVTLVERLYAAHLPSAIISPDGQRTSLSLDANGYISEIANPAGESEQFIYSPDGLLVSATDRNGNTSTMEYNSAGRLVADKNPAGGSWNFTESNLARLGDREVVKTSQLGRVTKYLMEIIYDTVTVPFSTLQKDVKGQLRTIIQPDGSERLISQFEDGRTVIDAPEGHVIKIQESLDPLLGNYSPMVTAQTVTTPGGLNLALQRDRTVLAGNDLVLNENLVINNRAFNTVFDNDSKTILQTSAEGRRTELTVDNQFRLLHVERSGIAPASVSYDARGRISSISEQGTQPRTVEFNYDAAGFLSQIRDPIGRTKQFDYDLVGRIISETLPDGRSVEYSYDPNGNLASITPAGGAAHVFNYTAVNQESKYTPPPILAGYSATQYFYNLDKQLTQVARSDGRTIDYQYDAGGRLDLMTIPRGEFDLDYSPGTGQLTSINAPDGGLLSFTYDSFLPLSQTWANGISGSVSMSYDNNFWITQLAVNTDAIFYQYDKDGLITQAGDLSLTHNTLNGNLTALNLNAVATQYDYNEYAELLNANVTVSGSSVYSASYQRDLIGRITHKTEVDSSGSMAHQYLYDPAGRLIEVKRGATTISSYVYDANGNRIGGFNEQGTISATYDEQDRLISYNGTSYAYNNHGDLVSKTNAGLTTQYVYDVLGNLMQVSLPGGLQVDYLIDGRNRRIGKKVGGTLRQGFLYQDQLNPIAELDGNNNVISRFVYGSKANVPDYMVKGGNTYQLISDHLGSPRLVVDVADGSVVQQIEYDEFGRILSDTNPGFQPFGFAGGLYDQHSELTRFGARDYDAEIGRWTIKDPIRFDGGVNLYAYVLNDPINFIDPYGLWAIGDPLPQVVVDATAGFGDALSFGFTDWVREQRGTNNAVDKCSGAFIGGFIAGAVTPGLGSAAALRGAAYLGKSVRGLNQGRYLRIGPGVISQSAGKSPFNYGAGRNIPMLRIGNKTPSSLNHFDLRVLGF